LDKATIPYGGKLSLDDLWHRSIGVTSILPKMDRVTRLVDDLKAEMSKSKPNQNPKSASTPPNVFIVIATKEEILQSPA